ncbi:hypothetical protein M885DRAFT_189709 [Pelagophyceae sp. CCMP2097]|nr:hypothetical protein M885DRAFT_189709 [Pelagophyceae sp. CCMP2097]
MVDDRVDAARHLGREIFALQNQARGRESELAASEAAREVLEDRASGLELERDAATQLLNDLLAAQGLGATGTGSTSRNLAAGQAAKRILVLSEEVKSVKLQNIVEKRELVSLRDSNRRLQASVAASEDALATADRARVEAEAKALLHVGNAFSPEGGDECFGSKKPLLGVDPRALAALALQLGMGSAELGTGRSIQGTSAALANVRLDEASERANAAHKGALELANDVREARQLASCAKQGEEEALRNAALLARAVDYYERTSGESAQDAVPGLAAAKAFLKQRGVAGGATLSPRTRPAQRDAFDRNDQSRLQAIATQTIASLKALVAEKNRALALAESRLEEGREAFRREAVADRAEIERLTEKVYREHEDAIDQLRGAAATIARADANAGGQEDGGGILSRRLEQVASELREQRHLNGDLERQRAELRCAEFMREIDLQKSDLVALAAQLHAAEERRLRLVEDKSGRQEVRRLQASLHDKEAKLRGFREALIKLKNEFVSAEESNAVAMVAHKEDTIARDDSALDALRESVQALKAQLKARAERDKLKGQHARLRGEVDALSGTAKEAEGRARELDDALSRARKECRELRANESELRRERRDHVDGTKRRSEIRRRRRRRHAAPRQERRARPAQSHACSGPHAGRGARAERFGPHAQRSGRRRRLDAA